MAAKRNKSSVVPTYFELGGFEWTVKFSDDLTELGKSDCHSQLITLRSGMSEQTTIQTFYHELVHAILFTMGQMSHDEVYVDAFAVFLHQFAKTQEW